MDRTNLIIITTQDMDSQKILALSSEQHRVRVSLKLNMKSITNNDTSQP